MYKLFSEGTNREWFTMVFKFDGREFHNQHTVLLTDLCFLSVAVMMIENFHLSTTASLIILNMNVKVIKLLLTSNLQF